MIIKTIANIRKAGITAEKLPDSYIIVDEKGVLLLGIDRMDHNSGVVEPGAKYIKADGTELTAGQNMPAPQGLDRYVYNNSSQNYQSLGARNSLSPCPALKYWINQEVSTVFSMPSYTDTHTHFFLPPLGTYERMA